MNRSLLLVWWLVGAAGCSSSSATATSPAADAGAADQNQGGGDPDAAAPKAYPSCGASTGSVVVEEHFDEWTAIPGAQGGLDTWFVVDGPPAPKLEAAGTNKWVTFDMPVGVANPGYLNDNVGPSHPHIHGSSTITVDMVVTILAGEEAGAAPMTLLELSSTAALISLGVDASGTPTAGYVDDAPGTNLPYSVGLSKLGTDPHCVRLSVDGAALKFQIFVDGQLSREVTLSQDLSTSDGTFTEVQLGPRGSGRPPTTVRIDDFVVRVAN